MLNADSRGHMEGWQVGKTLVALPTNAYVQELALQTFHRLQAQGYAHIEPEDAFLSGFARGLVFAVQGLIHTKGVPTWPPSN